jgi:hypothetical protein
MGASLLTASTLRRADAAEPHQPNKGSSPMSSSCRRPCAPGGAREGVDARSPATGRIVALTHNADAVCARVRSGEIGFATPAADVNASIATTAMSSIAPPVNTTCAPL